MNFRKCGIHIRLQNVIDKSDGYDIFAATEQLMKDYNIQDFFIAYYMTKDENIREKIKELGLNYLIKNIKEEMEINNMKFKALKQLL